MVRSKTLSMQGLTPPYACIMTRQSITMSSLTVMCMINLISMLLYTTACDCQEVAKLSTGSNAPSLQLVDFASVAGSSTRPATVSNAAALSTPRASAGPVRGPTLGLVSNSDAFCLADFASDAGGHSVGDCAESNCVAVLKHPSHIGRTRARPQLGFGLRFEAPFPC